MATASIMAPVPMSVTRAMTAVAAMPVTSGTVMTEPAQRHGTKPDRAEYE